ncbi:helix-turn-helix domain-containing protein [Devosia subaequoris]|uniref:helix-turn-helix domain-containing protein n=1 Tax=Devosia subaequoris TaxID=395930 RepID=UPI00160E19C0|nr:helix-turn-helix transcriptional regulator [Devosia subaequoris]MCP1211563.1 helix-turn-helix transcriptional regulator [Devosia subaequoris]
MGTISGDLQDANREVARGLDRTYISRVERGIRNPTVAVLYKIADGLSVSASQLLMPVVAE